MITSIFNSVISEPSIAPFVEKIQGFYGSYEFILSIALAVLCLVVGFFGRRLSGLVRVALLFTVGFMATIYWGVPLIKDMLPPEIPIYALGLAAGLFAAVMSRFLYDAAYVGIIAFDVYNICINALFFVEITSLTKGNFQLCLGIAFVVVLIALAVRKYLEMIVTAAAGGIGVAFFAERLFSYSGSMGMESMTAMLVVGGILAVPMFLFQYYNRVVY